MTDFPLTSFKTAAEWRAWLRRHHQSAKSILVRLRKSHAKTGIAYAEALDEALCYGWIDGVRRAVDGESFSIRFSPRKAKSIWSLVNVRHAERLISAGRMAAAGQKAFDARDAGRTGVYSFEQKKHELAPPYRKRFQARRKAWGYFEQEAPWYRRTSTHWVMSARKEETRERRLATLIQCCTDGVRIPPLRRP
ncbi:MAG TPA: YdeI/OmpD-associated family protein [Gemmatimonadales bacterium]|nr:YdeI/OmpD-associated family protein [Gemmatimonadales bacterium]